MDFCFYYMKPKVSAAACPRCGKAGTPSAAEHQLPCGTLLHRRYLIGRSLGEGGFGITYIGRDTVLDARVAVKEYYPNGYAYRSHTVSTSVKPSTSEERKAVFEKGLSGFLSEARTLERFSQEPGIVKVRDFFEENDTAYLIMEFLDGITLKEYVHRNGPAAFDWLLTQLQPITDALQKVHDGGLIHRDVSPDNIMLTPSGWKLLDFGAARNIFQNGNRSLSVILKPGYAPEEQYRSHGSQGPWTDVYALSATIYKCITGVTPPDSNERLIRDELARPSALGASIPPAAEEALLHGLSVLAENRFQSIEALMTALTSRAQASGWQYDAADLTQIGNSEEETRFSGYYPEDLPSAARSAQPFAGETAALDDATAILRDSTAVSAAAPAAATLPAAPARKNGKKWPIYVAAAFLAILLIGGTVAGRNIITNGSGNGSARERTTLSPADDTHGDVTAPTAEPEEDTTATPLKRPETKDEIIDFYKAAVNRVLEKGDAGYTRQEWQDAGEFNTTGNSTIDSVIKNLVGNYFTTEDKAEPQICPKGGSEAKDSFPNFVLTDYSRVKDARLEPSGANYKLTLVLQDEDTPDSAGSFLKQCTNSVWLWDTDVEPELANISMIKNYGGGHIIYRSFTITAEIAGDGRFISLTHSADVEFTLETVKVLIVNMADFSLPFKNTCRYTDFVY